MDLRYTFLFLGIFNGLVYSSDCEKIGIREFSGQRYDVQEIYKIYDSLVKDRDREIVKLVHSLAFFNGKFRDFEQFCKQIAAHSTLVN